MRADGKTTRTIDEAIQKLFKYGIIVVPSNIENQRFFVNRKKEIIIIDPDASVSGGAEIQRELFLKIRNRLKIEHKCMIEVDVREMTIKINKDEV